MDAIVYLRALLSKIPQILHLLMKSSLLPVCSPNVLNPMYEVGTSITKVGPRIKSNVKILKNVLTSSTCSVVKGPPYLDLAKSILRVSHHHSR